MALSRAAGLVTASLAISVAAGDWTAFRGPQGNGIALDEQPPTQWSRDANIRWRIPLPGSGNGSPIVVKGRVLLTCAKDHGRQRILYSYNRNDGSEQWHQVVTVDAMELTHIDNPYCGTTPVSDGSSVVVWHGTGGLHCYALDGTQQWSRSFGEIRHLWGYGNSPILLHDRVILLCGAGPRIFVAAVRLADGSLVWQTEEPGGQSNETPDGKLTGSWSTPVVVAVDGKSQIVCAMPTRIVAYDPENGQVLWSCTGLGSDRGDLVYASPLVGDGLVVVMAGYMGPAVAVRPTGSGEVTTTHRVWNETKHVPQRIGSGAVIDQSIYLGNADGGTIQCLDLNTGRESWRTRVPGGPHWASTVHANGLLYVINQSGITRVVRPNRARFELVSENYLDEKVHATPAFSDNEIFVRTAENLYCIAQLDLKK